MMYDDNHDDDAEEQEIGNQYQSMPYNVQRQRRQYLQYQQQQQQQQHSHGVVQEPQQRLSSTVQVSII